MGYAARRFDSFGAPMARWFILTSLLATAALADATAVARDAFMKGQSLYSAAKYKDALAKFEESFAAKPHPATIFNIARCQDQLGDLVRAMTSYKEYLRQSPQATDADEVATAIASIEQRLQKQGTQHLLVYVDPATARVSVDGKDIGSSPASATIAPGSHKVTIAAPGFDPYERAFAMSATRSMELTVSLRASAVVAVKQPDPVKPADPVKPPDAREPESDGTQRGSVRATPTLFNANGRPSRVPAPAPTGVRPSQPVGHSAENDPLTPPWPMTRPCAVRLSGVMPGRSNADGR